MNGSLTSQFFQWKILWAVYHEELSKFRMNIQLLLGPQTVSKVRKVDG